MKKLKKNAIDWLFNLPNACGALEYIGARNLTVIKAVYITSTEEEEIASYDKMIMYDSEEADMKAVDWMAEQVSKNAADERYLYFRFKRWN